MAENIRQLPIGVQSFEKLRQGGYIYVDKTRYVYNLVHSAGQYFLSRPGALARAFSSPPLRPIGRAGRNSLKGWP